jgi:hypothetical protein
LTRINIYFARISPLPEMRAQPGCLFCFLFISRRGYAMGLLPLALLGQPEVFHDESRLTFADRVETRGKAQLW